VLGVVILAVIVAGFGPGGYKASIPFANRVGAWVGPISGVVLMILAGLWTARPAELGDRVKNGIAVGVLGAALDLVLAAALGAGLIWLLAVSNIGRVTGGAIGGWLAARRVTPSAESSLADSSPAA
jgi:hypothetical protein